jgi:ABC-type branched-subunit amino acid transport system ATPase component
MLKTENLSVHYGQALALENISITVPEKGLTAVIGPNGAGKTCIINTITGFTTPGRERSIPKGKKSQAFLLIKFVPLGLQEPSRISNSSLG